MEPWLHNKTQYKMKSDIVTPESSRSIQFPKFLSISLLNSNTFLSPIFNPTGYPISDNKTTIYLAPIGLDTVLGCLMYNSVK